MNPVGELRDEARVTQGELAHRGGTSQPTIAAYEAGRKSPTVRTLARLAAAVGFELHTEFTLPLTREDRRSLELHRAIADKLDAEPAVVVGKARQNVRHMLAANPGAKVVLDEWRRVLRYPISDLVDVLRDPRPRARELRHVSPFAGVLTSSERWSVYRRFADAEKSR